MVIISLFFTVLFGVLYLPFQLYPVFYVTTDHLILYVTVGISLVVIGILTFFDLRTLRYHLGQLLNSNLLYLLGIILLCGLLLFCYFIDSASILGLAFYPTFYLSGYQSSEDEVDTDTDHPEDEYESDRWQYFVIDLASKLLIGIYPNRRALLNSSLELMGGSLTDRKVAESITSGAPIFTPRGSYQVTVNKVSTNMGSKLNNRTQNLD